MFFFMSRGKYAILAWFLSASSTFATQLAFIPGQFSPPVSDDAGGRLLLSSSGKVTSYDVTTGAVLEPTFAAGVALDISPDGTKLLTANSVAPAGSTSEWLSIHDLQTRQRVDYEFPNSSSLRIVSAAYADNNTVLFSTRLRSGSGGTELQRLDLLTGAVTLPYPSDEYGFTFLGAEVKANADRSVVTIFDPAYFGAFFIRPESSALPFVPADYDAAWNRDGTQLATASSSGLNVYDPSLAKVGTIARADNLDFIPTSIVYSPVSDVLYVSIPSEIIAYDANTLTKLGTIASLPGDYYQRLYVSRDGRRLFAQQFDSSILPINGIRIFDVSAFAVPEPNAFALACLALLAPGWRRPSNA
jgi:WD40 repeat protein